MAPPWVEPANPLIYVLLGFLTTLTAVVLLHWYRLREKIDEDEEVDNKDRLRTDNIGLSKKAEDTLDQVLDEPVLQNELPEKLEVSKATVSNAVSELKDRRLIKRKKKANTYLIEPDRDELEKVQK